MELSVVISLFNEEESLPILQETLDRVCGTITGDYEIVYVDDGSTDSSGDVLKQLAQTYPAVRFISLAENRGQSAGLYAGFKECRGEWIVTLDSDLQNPPEEISKLWRFRNDSDFITGIREKRRDSFLRKAASRIARFFRWIILKDMTEDVGCSLRLFRREVVEYLPYFRNFHRFFPFLAREGGFRIREVPLQHRARTFGQSKYTTWKRAKEGIFDLIGVFWLKRRLIRYEIKNRS